MVRAQIMTVCNLVRIQIQNWISIKCGFMRDCRALAEVWTLHSAILGS